MKKPLIINAPELQNQHQRRLSATLTLLFWLFWFWLWTPIVSPLFRLWGDHLLALQLVDPDNYQEALVDIVHFLQAVAMMSGILGLWAVYNLIRFKNIERRTAIAHVTTQQLANYFNVEAEQVTRQQQVKTLSVSFDKDGNIIDSHEITACDSSNPHHA
jgi:biofilm PGA synthesis protein PgaD